MDKKAAAISAFALGVAGFVILLAVGAIYVVASERRAGGSDAPQQVVRETQRVVVVRDAPATGDAVSPRVVVEGVGGVIPGAPPRESGSPSADAEPDPETLNEERRAFSASVFDAEPVDSAWAAASRQSLETGVQSLLSEGGYLEEVQCRSSLCRIRVDSGSQEAGQLFLRNLSRATFWQGPGMAVKENPGPRGEIRHTIYLAKAGAPLPEPNTAGSE